VYAIAAGGVKAIQPRASALENPRATGHCVADTSVATRGALTGMARSGPVFVVAAAIALGGCASLSQTVGGWFGASPPPTPTAVTARQGQLYYAAVDGLTVYEQSSSSSKAVGHLAQYERVTRSRVERGYAYVTAERGGLQGWVDNAQLVWRLPTAGGAPSGAAKGEPAAPGAAGAGEVAAPPEAEAAATEVPPTETPPPAQPTPTSTAQTQTAPKRPAPSIFDPY
jgi:hypothetical protein